jgi:predicted ArsR family transcriptional regulator
VDDPETVLLQPTRRRLFARLEALGRAATTAELAADAGLHPNGVRTQLALMADAGLVERRRAARPRGRPRDEWAIVPSARPRDPALESYETVSRWLARSIPVTPERLEEVRATGREIGRGLADGRAEGVESLVALLGDLDFRPQVEPAAGGRLACRLGNCPFRDAVRESQPVVCGLHRGITEGALEVLAPAARLERFAPHDPDRAGCEIEVALDGRNAA